MKPLYHSLFNIFWDGVFIILSAILLFELPAYIYAPTDQKFMDYQLFLIPLIILSIMVFYSLALRFIVIYPSVVVFKKPFGLTNRKISIPKKNITQVEIELNQRPKLTVYHHSEGTSIILYDNEVAQIKKAFAQIDINVD
ncbi:MAG: hypothetical protein Q8L88_08945 [Bacteroidota bacterium]|nr:hypothetical protein [Bacteroidota bacterium]